MNIVTREHFSFLKAEFKEFCSESIFFSFPVTGFANPLSPIYSKLKYCLFGKKQLLKRGPGQCLVANGASPAGTAGATIVFTIISFCLGQDT